MNTIITIGRQYGSGGREIGVRLAEKLGVPFYDKELLKKAAEQSGLCEALFDSYDERPASLLYSIAMDSYIISKPGGNEDTLEEQVHLAVVKAIRQAAEQGGCVIIGRCADWVLEGNPRLLSTFIYAPLEKRIERVAQRENLSVEKARTMIQRTDKCRAAYYEYDSNKTWGAVDSYQLCLDSSCMGLEAAVDILYDIAQRKEQSLAK